MRILDLLADDRLKLPHAEEQRLIISDITWEQYCTFSDSLRSEYPSLRITYLEGILEIMPTSTEHERFKTVIARLLEMYAVEKEIILDGYGNATFRKEAVLSGLEPDECYCVSELKEVPDIAIEITLSSGGIDKLDVYCGLAVPEVWFWQVKKQKWELYRLRSGVYESILKSEFLPDLDFDLIAQFILTAQNQTQTVIAYRDALRVQDR
jgi:Uma2 family endonuclease